MRTEQAGGERLAGDAQLGPGQLDRPGSGLDGHFPVPAAGPGPSILAGRCPLIAVSAEELGDLGLQRRLQQQLRAEPATSSRISGRAFSWANSSSMWPRIRPVGDTRCATGVGPSFDDLAVLKGTYARPLIYNKSWTPPRTGASRRIAHASSTR